MKEIKLTFKLIFTGAALWALVLLAYGCNTSRTTGMRTVTNTFTNTFTITATPTLPMGYYPHQDGYTWAYIKTFIATPQPAITVVENFNGTYTIAGTLCQIHITSEYYPLTPTPVTQKSYELFNPDFWRYGMDFAVMGSPTPMAFNTPLHIAPVPLSVGLQHTSSTSFSISFFGTPVPVNITENLNVEAQESVSVPAGTWTAFKCKAHVQISTIFGTMDGYVRMWFVPYVVGLAKEVDYGNDANYTNVQTQRELLSKNF